MVTVSAVLPSTTICPDIFYLTSAKGTVFPENYTNYPKASLIAEILAATHGQVLIKRLRDAKPVGRVIAQKGRLVSYELPEEVR